jgi:hypothetical protein
MRGLLFVLLLLPALAVRADETVLFCYNWSCANEARVTFPEPLLRALKYRIGKAVDAADERQRLAKAIGRLYAEAVEQSPIGADRAGNRRDAESDGRMDCIDHSTTTTRLLKLLERRGALHWHRVLEPVRRRRFIVTQHFSALVEENRPVVVAASDGADGVPPSARFVIDTWFVDPGQPALVLPLANWMDGEGPDVDN